MRAFRASCCFCSSSFYHIARVRLPHTLRSTERFQKQQKRAAFQFAMEMNIMEAVVTLLLLHIIVILHTFIASTITTLKPCTCKTWLRERSLLWSQTLNKAEWASAKLDHKQQRKREGQRQGHVSKSSLDGFLNHLFFFFMLYAVYLKQPHVVKVSSMFSVLCWPWVRAHPLYGGWTLIPLRGPLSAACFWAPSSRSAFYCVWFTAPYLWANSQKGGSPPCHPHIAQPLRSKQSPQTRTASMALALQTAVLIWKCYGKLS